jgi:hypothetical protein
MAQSSFYLYGALALMMLTTCQASLFLTPQEKTEARQAIVSPITKKCNSLKLKGIFYRPDCNYWIIWINNKRMNSNHPYSIDGWQVTEVNADHVIMRSMHGNEIELMVEISNALPDEHAAFTSGKEDSGTK